VEVLDVGLWIVCVPDAIGCCPVAGVAAGCGIELFFVDEAMTCFFNHEDTILLRIITYPPCETEGLLNSM
jgi:hypothetical protein